MIELNRHIEILLLSSDCVIVPELGGFMTHHVDARYDDEDHMFVPPLRTLGFNPQLTMNDSLLAQSYIEAYDISYPEAMRRIESEVSELKQQLQNEGYYEMSGIGVLCLNEDGRIVFEPCEAGLLTPSLYGLGAFEMLPLGVSADKSSEALTLEKAAIATLPENPSENTSEETADIEESASQEDEEKTIIIKMSWLRYVVAVAAAVLLFFLLTPPVANSDIQGVTQLTTSQVDLLPLPKKSEPKKLDSTVIKKSVPDTTVTTPVVLSKTADAPAVADKEEPTYCLVLASQVAQQGAENLVDQMKKHGFDDTRINIHKNVRRVVYGHFANSDAAYRALHKLQNTSPDFDEAWVYKTI